ncbi:hypothetical protein [Ruania albidiflava]|uniref:hypothetical protein n=1 Tax=Ruania albidiflava TaxID=366586 RepID=UPI0023F216E8|nr:hypothetical protein [Ruania albidiflava]
MDRKTQTLLDGEGSPRQGSSPSAPDVRNELVARAAREGKSLQEYLLGEMTPMAGRPAVADLVPVARERVRRRGRSVAREDILADRV